MRIPRLSTLLAAFSAFLAVSLAETCNPVTTSPGTCKPNVGLPQSTYSIDFTQQKAIPSDWTISNYATVNFGPKGAEFAVAKRFDSPQLWTNFYMFYGKVETVIQVAPGTGIVSSAVLMSDDADEIDWEFSGNNFGQSGSTGVGQNNYYGKVRTVAIHMRKAMADNPDRVSWDGMTEASSSTSHLHKPSFIRTL